MKTLDEILQEKKRRKEQEEKAEVKRLKNVSPRVLLGSPTHCPPLPPAPRRRHASALVFPLEPPPATPFGPPTWRR